MVPICAGTKAGKSDARAFELRAGFQNAFGSVNSAVPAPPYFIMDHDAGESFQSDYEGPIDSYIGTEEPPKDEVQNRFAGSHPKTVLYTLPA